MKNLFLIIVVSFALASCSTNSQLVYLKDSDHNNFNKVDYSNLKNNIEVGDVLKIDVQSIFFFVSIPYNTSNLNTISTQNIEILKLEGYLIAESMMVNYPVLGEVSVKDLSLNQLDRYLIRDLKKYQFFFEHDQKNNMN